MRMNQRSARLRGALIAAMGVMLAACHIVVTTRAPSPPSPFELATSLQVEFDYSGLMVEGMGGAKSESDWVAAKTAEDPEYPKTWTDLKSKWEENFIRGLSGGSPIPVSRAPVAAPAALRLTEGPVLLAQADTNADATDAANAPAPTSGDETAVATDATVVGPEAAAPAPAVATAPAPPPFDGVLTVRVSLTLLKMGKYIPMFTKNARVEISDAWLASGGTVEQSQHAAQLTPTLSNPSVFQHIKTLGADSGGDTARFLRKRRRHR